MNQREYTHTQAYINIHNCIVEIHEEKGIVANLSRNKDELRNS